MRVAIFDFDGTIYEGDTYQVLMDHLKNHPTYAPRYKRFLRAVLPPFIGAKLKIYPKQRMRARAMDIYLDTFSDLTKPELNTYFEEIAHLLREKYNPNVINRLNTHIHNQDYVMVVSGAYTQLLQTALNEFAIDSIVGTNIPFNNDHIDRSSSLYHVQGERKNKAIMNELQNQTIDWSNSYAYADSFSDLPVLELVGHPIAVHPEKRLYGVARERNWEVI